jgi:hypothetical protein
MPSPFRVCRAPLLHLILIRHYIIDSVEFDYSAILVKFPLPKNVLKYGGFVNLHMKFILWTMRLPGAPLWCQVA